MTLTMATAGTSALRADGPEPDRDWSAYLVDDPQAGAPTAKRMEAALEGVTCTACIGDVERGLGRLGGVLKARMSYATRRVAVTFNPAVAMPDEILAALGRLGFPGQPVDPLEKARLANGEQRLLLSCLGIAGFGMMNVMLLSISVWAGNVTDMTDDTRSYFHWVSMVIGLPCIFLAGRPFLRSAYRAIRHLRLNMDVPISLGILLATGLSVAMTITGGHETYFESALMLLFFLLLGRVLDETMRRHTHIEAEQLAALSAETALRLDADGRAVEVPASRIQPGERVLARPGDRIAVDATVSEGSSEVDCSVITGETALASVGPGDIVRAGTMNISGALTLTAMASARDSLLAEISRLLESASDARSRALQFTDRAARAYSPVVHSLAILTFTGWMIAGRPWNEALVIAISVLIITCPCALALAIPAVQVVVAGVMFRRGVLLASGSAVERLAEADTVIFDKTGTLTRPSPSLANRDEIADDLIAAAGALALASSHPLARVLATTAGAHQPRAGSRELTGQGVVAETVLGEERLGSPAFCGADPAALEAFHRRHPGASTIAYRDPAGTVTLFAVAQALRDDAGDTVRALRALGLRIEILSGDRPAAVAEVATILGIADWLGGADPAAKAAHVAALQAAGRKVLMIGDGLNDAPVLAGAHVSLSPASATRLARSAADAVFLGDRLMAIASAVRLARRGRRTMVRNLVIAVVYNALAVPLAIAGFVTPLIAALAMSGSSLIVTLNALSLRWIGGGPDGKGSRP